MKKLFMLLAILMMTSCSAQTTSIPDSTLDAWYDKFPEMRFELKTTFPNKFKQVALDTTLFYGWEIYNVNRGDAFYAVLKIDEKLITVIKLDGIQNIRYIKGFVGFDSLLVFGPSIAGNVPDEIQEFLNKLK